MKSRRLKCIPVIALFAALAIPLRPAAQEDPEGVTRANTGPANPVPLINQPLVPEARKPGGAEFMLTVNGTGFVSGSVVNWNGSPFATTFVSGSQLTTSVPAANIAKVGTAAVTVVNPRPGGGTSNAAFFEVTTPASSISLIKSDFDTGSNPQSVATGDFNGDGKLDLAEANYDSNTVSVLLGNGDGTFLPRVDYATGTNPVGIALGDFNGDGKVDLAVSNSFDNTVSILLGNGDGTFQAKMDYRTGVGAWLLATGDFNGDGKLDLAVACNDDVSVYTVCVLLGNGDGSFLPHVDYATGSWPSWVAVADFNQDGKLDLAVANAHSDTVSVLLGKGDGTFQGKVDYATGANPRSVAVGDFNSDGKLDLAVASQFSNSVSILLGNGDGTFQPHMDYGTGNAPVWVGVGDFNGDNKLDLALANFNDSTVNVLLGNGDGTFQAKMVYAPGVNPDALAIGDFAGRGRLDLAVANSGSNTISALLQGPSASLSKTALMFADQVVGTSSAPQTVKVTDTGVLSLTISSIAVTGTDLTDFGQANTCGAGISPGTSCIISITFKPTKIGPRRASVTTTDNAPDSPQSVALSGTGVTSGPNASLLPTSLTFATQLVGTNSPAQAVTLSNYGTMVLIITSVVASGDFSETNHCGSSLAPGESCTISVTFKPKQPGNQTGTLSITDNAPGSPQTVRLTGVGTDVELVPASQNFGTVTIGQTKTLSTTLTNVGSTTLSVTGITLTGSSEFSQTNTCGRSVGAGMSCTITVTFTPTGAAAVSGDVSISDNGGGSPQRVSLSGTGQGACGGSCWGGRHCAFGCKCFFARCVASATADLLNDLFLDSQLEALAACDK